MEGEEGAGCEREIDGCEQEASGGGEEEERGEKSLDQRQTNSTSRKVWERPVRLHESSMRLLM